jgi:hypothetical protein
VLGLWYLRPLQPGEPTVLCLVLYALCRFAEECLRERPTPTPALFTPTQWSCLALAAAGVAALWLAFPAAARPAGFTLADLDMAAVVPYRDVLLPLLGGILTTVVFSFHYGTVGSWDWKGSGSPPA